MALRQDPTKNLVPHGQWDKRQIPTSSQQSNRTVSDGHFYLLYEHSYILYIYSVYSMHLFLYFLFFHVFFLVSPLLPIIHRLWQVFRATTRILTGHNTNHIRNEPFNYFSIAGLIYNKTLNLFQLYCSPVGCGCRIRRLHHCQTGRTH